MKNIKKNSSILSANKKLVPISVIYATPLNLKETVKRLGNNSQYYRANHFLMVKYYKKIAPF